ILHRNDAPWLLIAPGRSPGRRFEHAMQHLIGNPIGFEPPYRSQRAHRFVHSHFSHRRSPLLANLLEEERFGLQSEEHLAGRLEDAAIDHPMLRYDVDIAEAAL